MNNYTFLCEAWDRSILKETAVGGGLIGAAAGGGLIAFNEWMLHWVKEFRSVILCADNIQKVKDWYDKEIVDDEAIYWTRKGVLKWDYFSRALNNMVQRNDPDWKRKMLNRCNKLLMVYRITGSFVAAYYTLAGAVIGENM